MLVYHTCELVYIKHFRAPQRYDDSRQTEHDETRGENDSEPYINKSPSDVLSDNLCRAIAALYCGRLSRALHARGSRFQVSGWSLCRWVWKKSEEMYVMFTVKQMFMGVTDFMPSENKSTSDPLVTSIRSYVYKHRWYKSLIIEHNPHPVKVATSLFAKTRIIIFCLLPPGQCHHNWGRIPLSPLSIMNEEKNQSPQAHGSNDKGQNVASTEPTSVSFTQLFR